MLVPSYGEGLAKKVNGEQFAQNVTCIPFAIRTEVMRISHNLMGFEIQVALELEHRQQGTD